MAKCRAGAEFYYSAPIKKFTRLLMVQFSNEERLKVDDKKKSRDDFVFESIASQEDPVGVAFSFYIDKE